MTTSVKDILESNIIGYTGSRGFTGSQGSGFTGSTGFIGSMGRTYVSNTAPTGVAQGDTWYNSDTGKRYVYYTDIDSSQWVQESAPGPSGPPGPTGPGVTTGKAIAMAMIFGG
jgi:hypothetical protein